MGKKAELTEGRIVKRKVGHLYYVKRDGTIMEAKLNRSGRKKK